MNPARRREMVDREHPSLPIVGQCALLGVSRSSLYYRPKGASEEDLSLMREIDRQYLATPFYGSRRMKVWLERQGTPVSRKRVQRLMRVMGLRAIYRRPRTSRPAPGVRVYPYLLGKAEITRPNQVWAADITYLPMARGFLYLVAVMDWHSRYVLSWRLSNTMEAGFCAEALTEALERGRPEVFNTDQGSQFTSSKFTQVLQDRGAKISMDGKGRYADNIFVERLWRTVKYEEVYLKAYASAGEARRELGAYFRFYNDQRPHQALGYRTPGEVFSEGRVPQNEESTVGRWSPEADVVSYAGAAGPSLRLRLNSVQLTGSTSFIAPLVGDVSLRWAVWLFGLALVIFAATPPVIAGHYNLFRYDPDRIDRPSTTRQEKWALGVVSVAIGACFVIGLVLLL